MADPNNNQMAFWEAMKEKYERRNDSLKQQEICLRKRLEQLKQIMEKQKAGDDCDCVPEKLEKPSLVQCLVEKGKNLILGSCKCGDPKVGEDLLCACHIQDPKAPLNVDPNLCPLQDSSPPDGCLNPTCDFYDPNLAHMAENPSTFSLKTTDIYYMDKLADLVKAEKSMQDKIEDLENREHSYLTAIHDLQEAMKVQPKENPINKEFKKLAAELEEENKKLKNELEDLRLELKHCFERLEGPLRRSLEDQRDKCSKLENQLKDLQTRTKMKEDSYLKEISEVKAKLCKACCTMVDLNNVNSKLKADLDSLQTKCGNLEDELLKQQLKEAENILRFKNALNKRKPKNKIQAKGDESEQDLTHVAKKLGDTLKEICPCVSNVPSGLAETAENIRQLTEFVGEKGAQQRKKRKGKIPQNSTSSCSCGSNTGACFTPPKYQGSVDNCTCSNSSLRLKPIVGKNDFVDQSSSATLVAMPTMNLDSSKQITTSKTRSTMKRTDTTAKTTSSKGCTCCPAQNECDQIPAYRKEASVDTVCYCSEMDNKKIGPSEEVIAVKNLGTLSMPPGEIVMQAVKALGVLTSEPPEDQNWCKPRREKLAVDTTCDVLDVPPKDIHVVTTIAKTGSLEITTEGPPGIIETKVNYLPDGKLEIVTKLIDHHKMDNFLDGTLLHVPDGPPDCEESNTCDGQCDERPINPITGCPEIDCNKSKTCGGICHEEVEKADMNEVETSKRAESSNPPIYKQVVVDNNFTFFGDKTTNPFTTQEWKNTKFLEDPTEERSHNILVIKEKPKSKRQEKTAIHNDVSSEQELFRLSSKQSLTDVEKVPKVDKISCSSDSFVFPDVLDTISEGDEEQMTDSSKNDENTLVDENEEVFEGDSSSKKSFEMVESTRVKSKDSDDTKEVEQDDIARSSSMKIIEKIEPLQYSVQPYTTPLLQMQNEKDEQNTLVISEMKKSLRRENVEQQKESPLSSKMKMSLQISPITVTLQEQKNQNSSSDFIEMQKSSQQSMNLTPVLLQESEDPNKPLTPVENKKQSQDSLTNCKSATIFEKTVDVRSECQYTESFFKLSRNINLLSGRITLKQSKSMYEKKGYRSEYLRICKSATLSLGTLKIDLERLKLSKDPNVGDFGSCRDEDKISVLMENTPVDPLGMEDCKSPLGANADEKVLSEVFKDGCNTFSPISEQRYQCYVCSCSNQKDKDNQQKKNAQNCPNNQGLAERIDRLLDIDPLAVNHGEDCQCVDCLVQNVQRDVRRTRRTDECKCARKRAENLETSRKKCKCGSRKADSAFPKLEEPKHQGDVQHGENCMCVDCICNPCNFKKTMACDCSKCECDTCYGKDEGLTSLIDFNLSKPQEFVVMNVGIPCDCGAKCPCSPCMDDSKKKPLQKPKSQTQAKPGLQGKAQTTSCQRCASRLPGAQADEPKKNMAVSSSRMKPQPSTEPPASILPDTWKNVVGCPCPAPVDDKKAVCDCKTCECKPCGYPEKARKPCDCKPPKKEPKSYGPSGKCDCSSCKCEYCGDTPIGDFKRDVSESDPSNNPSVNNCNCKLCECLFCSDQKARKQSQPTVLNEKLETSKKEECVCKPKCLCEKCPVYAEKLQEVEKKATSEAECVCKPKCLCEKCPVYAEKMGDVVPQQDKCACKPKCLCEKCPVLEKIGDVSTPQKERCGCKPKCLCEKCPVLNPKIGDVGTKCDCTKCECDPCFGTNSLASKNLAKHLEEVKEADDKKTMTFDKKVACDCDTCKCDDCMANHKVDSKHEKNRGDNSDKIVPCDCTPCECDSCKRKSQESRPPDKNKGDTPDKAAEGKPKKNGDPTCPCTQLCGNEPMEDCEDCGICCSEPSKKDFEIIPKFIPCDCHSPCPCFPCPDPKLRGDKEFQMIGDADRAKEEIKNVLNQIGCTCDQVEVNLKPLVKQASNFETTISRMKMKLTNLQQKCTDKDQIIDAMTNELRMRSQSGVFADLLHDLAHPNARYTPDFTRANVCDFLPKPNHLTGAKLQKKRSSLCRFDNRLEPILELDRYLPGAKEDASVCPRTLDVSGMEIIDIRRVTIDSILIKWRGPPSVNGINGYQIFVNDQLKYRVLSPNRTNAVIDSLDLSSSLEFMLFAITSCGRCEPPALATYKI